MGSRLTIFIAALLASMFFFVGLILLILSYFLNGDNIFQQTVSIKDTSFFKVHGYVDVQEILNRNKGFEILIYDSELKPINQGIIKIDLGCPYINKTKKEILNKLKRREKLKYKYTKKNVMKLPIESGSNVIIDICEGTISYKVIFVSCLIGIGICLFLMLIIIILVISTLCGCCKRTNTPRAIVIMTFLTFFISLICTILEPIREKMFYVLMGLEDNDVAVQYGFPKRNVNMLALLGCITIIISNILFIILMSCASRERDYEIQEAKDLSLEGRINRITYRAINKYKSAPVTRRRLKDTKPTKSFNSTPNSGN